MYPKLSHAPVKTFAATFVAGFVDNQPLRFATTLPTKYGRQPPVRTSSGSSLPHTA